PEAVARGEAAPALAIPDETPAGVTSTIAIAPAGRARRIKIGVDITHTYIGDLIIELTNPAGMTITLHDRAGGATHNLTTTYDSSTTAALAAMINQPIAGDWTLRVRDVAVQDVGTLNRWTLQIDVDANPKQVHAETAPKMKIPDNDPTGISSFISMTDPGAVQQLKVGIDITHTYIGDLRVELVAPSGRRAILHSRLGGSKDDLVMTYDSSSPLSELTKLVGQPVAGPWVLRVTDLAGQDVGTLNRWSIDALTA
ncbi:MAG TPA: proprotein convertase P-domain-containing protein, partial [Kofleriaceae bacterium]|nr:proprotein convertase P-domain-containing protein [Kofleriaceae bacterium]